MANTNNMAQRLRQQRQQGRQSMGAGPKQGPDLAQMAAVQQMVSGTPQTQPRPMNPFTADARPIGGGMGAGPTQGPDPEQMAAVQQMVRGTPQSMGAGAGGLPLQQYNPSPGSMSPMGMGGAPQQSGPAPMGQGLGGMGGKVMKKGGSVSKVSSASSRGDGCATKGKTKGRFV